VVRSNERRLVWRGDGYPTCIVGRITAGQDARYVAFVRLERGESGDRPSTRADGRHATPEPVDELRCEGAPIAREARRHGSDADLPGRHEVSRAWIVGDAAIELDERRAHRRQQPLPKSVHLRGRSGLTAHGVALPVQGAAVGITDVWGSGPRPSEVGIHRHHDRRLAGHR
jgi:hypothetical protein